MPVVGLTSILAKLDAVYANQVKQIGDAVQNAGIVTEAVAKQRSPVKTGRLRAGNQYVKTGPTSCKVGNAVSYARPVELGHRTSFVGKDGEGHMVAPSPFLFPGYLAGKAALRSDLGKITGLKIINWS
jgi:hypothetical protein